jgi:hypothetical protein
MADINTSPQSANVGLNLSSIMRQKREGELTFAMNAVVENFDGNTITYQNESGNVFCVSIPEGYTVNGKKHIIERNLIILWLINESTGEQEVGKIIDCEYSAIINSDCIGLDIDHPIHKVEYSISGDDIYIFWANGLGLKFINLNDLPYKEVVEGCKITTTTEIDCNKLNVQPNFNIPEITVTEVDSDGLLKAGAYQFAIQYADGQGNGYTSFYSVTNPTTVFDKNRLTMDFNYEVSKSIALSINNIDVTSFYDYINVAVIKTINNISSADLIGTYQITGENKNVVYTGQSIKQLDIQEIFVKYPIYKSADDVTSVQDILVWSNLTKQERISYQKDIANQITVDWQTWRVPDDAPYADEENQVYVKGYMRDEVAPLEIVFLLTNGHQTDGFHIPGRVAYDDDLEIISNDDSLIDEPSNCEYFPQPLPKWKVYNTGCVIDYDPIFKDFASTPDLDCPKCPPILDTSNPECYTGPYQYGCMAYWESTETYPCDEDIWGDLAGKPIRHHKFPDSLITHIHDNQGFVYPIGFRINVEQVKSLILNSSLTEEQKSQIAGFKIVRGNRANNKSIVAKGLFYNVGKYGKEGSTYYYPNYPYNDVGEDPFINTNTNYVPSTGTGISSSFNCKEYIIVAGDSDVSVSYTTCDGITSTVSITANSQLTLCSSTEPAADGIATVTPDGFCDESGGEIDEVVSSTQVALNGFATQDSRERYTFHSPDTHFTQPTLGNIVKMETAEFGEANCHFTEVRNHAKYAFLSDEAVLTAFAVGTAVGFASNTVGVSINAFNGTAAWTAFQTLLDIIQKTLPDKNFTYQYSSVGKYTDFRAVPNNGNKQRFATLAGYASPGMISVGDDFDINNYQRESSVYLRTYKALPFVHTLSGVPEDNTRFTLSEEGLCDSPNTVLNRDISSYYGSIKRNFPNQYGQIYSYETIDTGFQWMLSTPITTYNRFQTVFGGDTFINRFGLKRKYPFFLDNRVSPEGTNTFADGSDIQYNQLGNIGYPKYWFSTDIRRGSLTGLFGVRDTAFDCRENKFFYDSGKVYLFAYGVPYFYCESQINVDNRQAFNNKEGDFYPRVSSGIPDDWVQETRVSIQHDNTYYYNLTYSKQNKENFFSHIPEDYDPAEELLTHSLIYSDVNNWWIYRPAAVFSLPQVYGDLVSINGIENKQLLVGFTNRTKLYNALLTAPTSAQDVYLGQSLFDSSVPPLDFAETELGYAGTQHKLFIKTEYGHLQIDAMRGQVFLFQGKTAKDITGDGMSDFFKEHLPFIISSYFPEIDTDNNFKDIGLHAVFDTHVNRIILTKLDYEPKIDGITYSDGRFYINGDEINLSDSTYFANRSFTISFDFDTQTWISFHSYLPNYYIGGNGIFYSNNGKDIWVHNRSKTLFNNFYGEIAEYTIEYPKAYEYNDEILQNIKDYTQVIRYSDDQTFVQTNDIYFNKCILSNNQGCSGILELTKKPKNNLSEYKNYPKYHTLSKEILYTKSDSFYNFNTFWSMVKDADEPIWKKSETIFHKELNQSNMDYTKRSRQKAPLRAKDLKIRMTLDNRSDVKMISQFIVTQSQISYK